MTIKNKIVNNIIQPSIDNNGISIGVAIVIESNESSNKCSIMHYDTYGTVIKKDNVNVVKRDNWFPNNGDVVLVRFQGKSCVIESEYVSDYNLNRESQKMSQNKTPNNNATVGGFVF